MIKPYSQTLRMLMVLVLAIGAITDSVAQTQVEFWFDSDPGMGQGTTVTASTDANGDLNFSAPTDGLEPGPHLLGVRAYHPGEHPHFAPTILQQIYVPRRDVAQISCVEYFWDNDPGVGKATSLDITPGHELDLNNIEIPTTNLTPGTHLLGLRAFGEGGWAPTLLQEVLVPNSDAGIITRVEYFWDQDPGFGQGTAISIVPGQEVNLENVEVAMDGLSAGDHSLFVRAFANGRWGSTLKFDSYLMPDASQMVVSNAEYFWNDDPGFGKATPINITPGSEIRLEDFPIPSSEAHGDAVLFIRYRGTMGWSPTVAYPVMVDAEGNYTLNSGADTSMESRNYKTLSDAFDDFADRGISNDITLTVKTKNTDYALDATDENRLSQLAQIAGNLTSISDNHDHKLIDFTAAEGSGNTLTVTTTDEGLPTVVSLFAQTSQRNVDLTINGTAYNFTPASLRSEEGCADRPTTPVNLSAISTAVKATWQAQPHDGTTLSGYVATGEGDMPEMTITNSGTKLDSLAYLVTLSTTDGQALCSYTYYIFIHALVGSQSFSTLSPANGSSLDPVTTTLQWNAIGDAKEYRLEISETPEGGEPTEIVNTTTGLLKYDLDVKSGCTYTWTVTAVGYCDELTSAPQTLQGRLLPDLTVQSITLPEAAQAGNQLTVTAIIKNQGTGATTEGAWTDRLYYVIDSDEFTDAVEIANVRHEGNLATDASYEVTFTIQVPYVEEGYMKVFVEADADGDVMEAADDNNRLLSTSQASLAPFYMNTDDLAALRLLFNDFDGQNWNGTRWNIESELIASGNWSGVTFDGDGRVTAVNLQGRGLSGSLSSATPLSLPLLTSLNLSRNALTGDPSDYIGDALPLLTSADLSYNQIDELARPLPSTITNLALTAQHRQYGKNTTYPGIGDVSVKVLEIGTELTVDLPAFACYDHKNQNFSAHPSLNVWTTNLKTRYGRLVWSNTNDCYTYECNNWNQTQQQDEDVILVVVEGWDAAITAYPGRIHLMKGDVNLTGWVDVNDVQRTLNYIINTNNTTAFNFWSANTWEDDLINIQDIVCTVNIVLDNQGESPAAARRLAPMAAAPNRFYASGRSICLEAQDEIAAFDLTLEGVSSSQVRLMLNGADWQMLTRETADGLRLVVFSPTGQTLPTGRTQLLRLAADGWPVDVQATSINAEELPAAASSETTRLDGPMQDENADNRIWDLQGRRVEMKTGGKSTKIYIKNGKKVMKSWK